MGAESLSSAPPTFLRIVEAVDLRVLVPALALTGTGLLALASTRPDLVGTQLTGVVVGIAAALALVLLPYRTVLAAAWPLYVVSLLLLALVLVPGIGVTIKGAQRWIRVGSVQLQPSELAKVAQVLVLARYIRFRQDQRTFQGLFVPFLIVLLPATLVLVEPDLGSALLLVPSLFTMLWASGARTRHLLLVVLFGVLSVPAVYPVLKQYQRNRIDAYAPFLRELWQKDDRPPTDAELRVRAQQERDARHQVERAGLAVAAGGVLGAGWGEGRMNLGNKVPEDWTDFIYVVHAEEWGFAGTIVLVLLTGLLLFSLVSLAQECREPAARLMCVGVFVTLGCQTCVNLMMTLELAPVTGVPLPFLSYGRSSMLCSWLLVGLALHAKAREPHVFTRTDFD